MKRKLNTENVFKENESVSLLSFDREQSTCGPRQIRNEGPRLLSSKERMLETDLPQLPVDFIKLFFLIFLLIENANPKIENAFSKRKKVKKIWKSEVVVFSFLKKKENLHELIVFTSFNCSCIKILFLVFKKGKRISF